ncbi:hypothetical protein ACIBL3_13875 [Kribbella sp. NPDC050124]|uniref:hypothetical protein n=1 Tax=Kribbella sp. NPDC050124 TaxID=3364114 RepID=UPI00379CA06C
MAFRRGRLLDPRSQDWARVAAVIRTVASRMERQQTRWNGRIYLELSSAEGAAGPDGGMSVSDPTVLQPLERAFRGEDLTPAELYNLRDALVTLTHESLHLCHEVQDADGNVRFSAAERAFEEGLAENWAQDNVHHVIRALQLDVRYPELPTQPRLDAYPALQAASKELVSGVATLAGRDADDVGRQLQGTRSNERFGVVADLVIEARRDEITGDVAEVRGRLEQALQEKFAPVLAIEGDNFEAKAERGAEVGRLTLAEVDRVLTEPAPDRTVEPQRAPRTWEEEILAWQQQQQAQAAQQAPQQPAAQTWEDEVLAWQRQQAQPPAFQPQGQQPVQAQGQQSVGDVGDLRKFLDDQRPGLGGGVQAAEASAATVVNRDVRSQRTRGHGVE